jgi:hypothetical protein
MPLDLGSASVRPQVPVVAGSLETVRLTYTVGHPIDDSGYLKIVFRQVSDFGTPQFDCPSEPNFCTVRTTGNCRIEPRWDPKGHTRPWSRALFLKVRGGYLDRGEKVTVVFGDRQRGSLGWQMQTFCEGAFEFKTLVDPIATYVFKELPQSPSLCIIPGEPERAICVAPSHVSVEEAFSYYLKLEDRWGNPVGPVQQLRHPGFPEPGVRWVQTRDVQTGLTAESNPIAVRTEEPTLGRYWGDLHGQTGETVGSRSIEDYFTFARDCGLLDISAHQGNDFQVTDELWAKINRVSDAFHEPGRFLTLPGYEWSGNTPLGGDRNVYFDSAGGQIVHSCTDLLPAEAASYKVAPTAEELFRSLRREEKKTFVLAHAGGRYADLDMHDAELEVGVEVHSAWGTFEWLIADVLRRGYRVGFCANSDGHKCRPGASYPGATKFGSLGGLTCVRATGLNRDNVFEALMARHFYATTGHRPLVDVELTTEDGRMAIMGDAIEAADGEPVLDVRVVGTAPVECVLVHNGSDVIATYRPYDETVLGKRVKVVWAGAQARGRDRVVRWDGGLRVRGNTILSAVPVNFWNPERRLRVCGQCELAWESSTTGGLAGVILTLDRRDRGVIEIETAEGSIACSVAAVGYEPQTWRYGGVGKRVDVYRLPDGSPPRALAFELSLNELHGRDNAIYVRTIQEDGHLAWSSPIYIF